MEHGPILLTILLAYLKMTRAVKLSSIFSADPDLIRMRNLISQNLVDTEGLKYLNDGKNLSTESWSFGLLNFTFSPVHHFRFKVGKFGQHIDYFEFSWWYGNYSSYANIDSVQLYAWNYSALFGLGLWENIGNVSYDTSIGTNADGDINVVNSYDGYVNNDGYMDFLIVALPDEHGEPSILDTDYVNVSVKTAVYCYAREGYIVSTNISPPSLGRWESLIWSGSPLSDSSSLKIRVLNSDGNLIDDYYLPGNSDGFTISPIDLSNLPRNTIKLNASFQSNDLSVTPWLKSWGVTWQTGDSKFHDDFDTNLRIDKAFGVKFAGSKINMSTDYSDWPIYGKNPENTRSYEGYGPSNATPYQYTEGTAVGGGLRSPILSDGVIYVASSSDQKIHAFDADNLTSLVQSSELPHLVDASVAITDNLVIVATSEMNQSNAIYALNKSTLAEEWNYSYGNGTEDVCFSSAPIISGEKVFVTSWNGMGWDMPLLSILYELQLLEGNNKIIALNLNDGTEIWNASLPAGSFSTPAVADGMVFVGCDNLMGSSLFAFDEETGAKVWDTSIGLIGRGSPVIYDNKVFVVVKDQNLISLTGDVKVIAVDEYNGTVLWDTAIATNIPAFESLPKALQLYNIMATSTPAIYEATLFATSTDGKLSALKTTDGGELWSVDLPSGLFGLLPLYPCTSPVATANRVYAASADGVVHAFTMSGEKLWDFRCVTNQSDLLDMNYILAAPIVADGVLYVSVTEELANLSGRIFSIGNATTQQRGKVISNPIHVPKVKWWDKFEVVKGTGNITFSILDEHYNVLLDDVKDEGDISNSSIINTNVIRLCAKFSKEGSENPLLYSWSIIWKANTPPVLDYNSFIPNSDGWVNTNTPVCSINVYDAMPGLNVDSARYYITYVSDENESVASDWISANCSGTYGTPGNQTIVADISALNLSDDIAKLKSIKISIQDLAAYESTINVSFKANASDPGDPNVNKSDVKNVTLYYRLNGDEEWIKYGTDVESPYNWSFDVDTSGDYELCTIATDNAGNVEDYPSQQGDVSFLYDTKKPYISTEFAGEYRSNKLPEFSITFKDDFKLEKIEYSPNFETEWTEIEANIDEDTYDSAWFLLQRHWDNMTEGKEYYIYFRIIDICGNQYETPSDDEALELIKDFTTFKSYLDLSDFREWHWDNVFTITTNIPDDSSITNMELYYRYSPDNEEWSEWERYGGNLTKSPFKWEFTAEEGSGYYEFNPSV
jgi:outer membrane protein assembly factor BamB